MVFDLTKEITSLGRDVANDIVIGDPEVSRQHSRLTRTPGGFVLEDLGSTNGTFVNGERLTAPRVLKPGDVIGLSEKVTLSFETADVDAEATKVSPQPEFARGAPTIREDPPMAVSPTPPPPPEMQPMGPPPAPQFDEEPTKRSPWIFAGCGCLILIVVLGVVFWYMDANYPDILYAPLRLLGF
jgi:predicted component of type VI protein secretion system